MRIYLRTISYLRPYTIYILGSLIATLVVTLVIILLPQLIQDLVDKVLLTKDLKLLTKLLLNIILLLLLKEIAWYFQVYLISYAGQKMVVNLRRDFFEHLLRLSLSFYSNWRTGDLISRAIQDITIIRENLVENSIRVIPLFLIFIGLLIKTFLLNFKLTLIILLFLIAIWYLSARFGKMGRRESKRLQLRIDQISSLIKEVVSGIKTVLSFCCQDYEEERFNRMNEEGGKIAIFRSKLRALQDSTIEFITVLGLAIVVWVACSQLIRGEITPGRLIGYLTCLFLIAEPLTVLARAHFFWQQAAASSERIFEVIDIKEEVEERLDAEIMPRVQGMVEFIGVDFSYEDREILKGIDFKIYPGEKIALVGRSGAGKTTLLNLIPRFYDPTNGSIKIDGRNIRDFKLSSLREQIGIVPQDPIIFSGSIKSNILYGRLNSSDEEVIEAAKAANIHQFIISLKDGYDSETGEDGVRLSAGERQRLAIARTILKDPRIIILDEPTANLDPISETLVNEAFSELTKGKTTFIIAHRLSTVMHADRLFVLDNGRIVQMGSHKELLEEDGLYASLFAAQSFV